MSFGFEAITGDAFRKKALTQLTDLEILFYFIYNNVTTYKAL